MSELWHHQVTVGDVVLWWVATVVFNFGFAILSDWFKTVTQ